MIRFLSALLLLGFLVGLAAGQQLSPPPAPAMPKSLPLHSPLYEATQLAESAQMSLSELQAELTRRNITLSDAERIHVEIVGPKGSEGIPTPFVESLGGEMDTRSRHRADCWIPIRELVDAARAIPEGYFIENANTLLPTEVVGEGPAVINSIGYTAGDGMSVAICDLGFEGLSAAIANGDAPMFPVLINYTEDAFESGGVHGTGCTEAVFDHCPNAAFRLYKLDSLSDLDNAVYNALDHGVHVLSLSLSRLVGGWHDNEGDACHGANLAGAGGILFFTAAGNYAMTHWQGIYNAGEGSASWHNFLGADETINMDITDGETVSFGMQWNTDSGEEDYDLYLYDLNENVLASSTNPGSSPEYFTWTNTTGATVEVMLAVYRDDGGSVEFEIFTHGGAWREYIVPASSTTSPSNATHPNVISVGAAYWGDYDAPGGTGGVIADYSSRGPTNDGMPVPDLCGPAGTNTFVYGGEMHGTSNSTPNCAGAAVCLRSADPVLWVEAIRWLIFGQAALWKDWGSAGQDNVYGVGGMVLVDFAPNTLWIARSYGNHLDHRYLPFYHVAPAQGWAEPGARLLVFPGGNYPEPVTLYKVLTVETAEYPAILGE